MRNNGFSKDAYFTKFKLYFAVYPSIAVIMIVIMVLWIKSIENSTGIVLDHYDFRYRAIDASVTVFFASLLFGLFYLIVGPFIYKRYARQVIENEDNVKAENIFLNNEHLQITYLYRGKPEKYEIQYTRYGISVKNDIDCKKPTFYIEGDRVKELILPIYPRPFYNGYKVVNGENEKVLCM